MPPDLQRVLYMERKRRTWRRYLPLWGGAVAVGLACGIVPSILPHSAGKTAEPRPEVAPQTVPSEIPSAQDEAWAERGSDVETPPPSGVTTTFGFCHTGGGTNCVVDGDTIWLGGQNIRIADIDAPETHEYRCASEKALGDRATQRLHQLVNSGSVTLQSIDRDQDTYGRKLRLVMVNGTSVGDTLVSEGLARHYEGGKKPWC